jgi:50S ribosomal subunit-associated GTPase HflX
MALQVGIVGLPNVGKSTLFKALTKKPVDINNYPFCTIEPNVGIVEVPDERLAKLAALSGSKKILPAVVEFVDRIVRKSSGAEAEEEATDEEKSKSITISISDVKRVLEQKRKDRESLRELEHDGIRKSLALSQ